MIWSASRIPDPSPSIVYSALHRAEGQATTLYRFIAQSCGSDRAGLVLACVLLRHRTTGGGSVNRGVLEYSHVTMQPSALAQTDPDAESWPATICCHAHSVCNRAAAGPFSHLCSGITSLSLLWIIDTVDRWTPRIRLSGKNAAGVCGIGAIIRAGNMLAGCTSTPAMSLHQQLRHHLGPARAAA